MRAAINLRAADTFDDQRAVAARFCGRSHAAAPCA